MNIANLTKALQVKLSTATSAADLLILTKSIQRLQIGVVDTVSTYNELLALQRQPGDLVFVDGEQKLYVARAPGIWSSLLDTVNSAWSWGSTTSGHLGNGTSGALNGTSSPGLIAGGFNDWVQVDGPLGIRANGTAWAWGPNIYGRIGDNTTTSRTSPVSVVGGITDWIQVTYAFSHTLGLRTNGTAWAWGNNNYGRLGDNTLVSKSSPISVVGGFTDWAQVSAGSDHSTGIRANGTAWVWGRNTNGQLGDNTTVAKSSPVLLAGGFTDWVEIAATTEHTIALRANGTAWTWGRNYDGRLGDNSTIQRSSPVSVVGGFTNWIQVSAGTAHTVGLRSNGTIWTWGRNVAGQLGDNTTVSKSSPVSVVGGITDWVQVSAGGANVLALRANGSAWGWGSGGQMGDGTTTSRSSPVSVVGGFTDWVQVLSGSITSFGLR
jgi:alpha-tubulin suppressor-like RCC1 family protein